MDMNETVMISYLFYGENATISSTAWVIVIGKQNVTSSAGGPTGA